MNRFPYKLAQLLFFCGHKRLYADLSKQERNDVDGLTKDWKKRLKEVLGFNSIASFSNEGHACTGGTIPEHWHRHVYAGYDSSLTIERPLQQYMSEAERGQLYTHFLNIAGKGPSGASEFKLGKVYSAFRNVLDVAKKRKQKRHKEPIEGPCAQCEAINNSEHPLHKYELKNCPDFTVYLNSESPFFGEVIFVSKKHGQDLGDESSILIEKFQKILSNSLVMDGFSCSEDTRGEHAVFTIRPRKVPQIFTKTLDTGEVVVNGDPDQIYEEVKGKLAN